MSTNQDKCSLRTLSRTMNNKGARPKPESQEGFPRVSGPYIEY